MPNSETKTCQNCKKDFVIESDDFAFYEKMDVPAPAFCPECRFKRRAVWRNEMSLYNHVCQKCGESMISMYHPESPYVVYCIKCYESDAWDPKDYAVDYDQDKPFFKQFSDLLKKVPKKAVYTSSTLGPNINSEYTNMAGGNKNCYLIFNSGLNEDSMYSRGIAHNKGVSDVYFSKNLEQSYEAVNAEKSSGILFGQNVLGSVDSMFVLNVSGLTNCFGCVNLRHKSYHFFNEEIDKEEYNKRLEEIKGSYSKTQEYRVKFESFALKFPRRADFNIKSVDSSGEYLFNCKNVTDSFEAAECEDCRYLFSNKYTKDSYDLVGFGYYSNLLLDCVAVGNSSDIAFSWCVEDSQSMRYVAYMRGSSKDCFGCDGMHSASYCILNKQYDKLEYLDLRNKILDQMKTAEEYGQYMPPSIAPFSYNETVAMDNLPLTKEEALNQGYTWQDNLQMTTGKGTIKSEEIPDHIKGISDSMINEVLECISCKRNYKITKQELSLYRQLILPIPRKCFYCRHQDRLVRRGPMKIYDRACDKCSKDIKTSYAPDRPEIVYCEQCYQAEVV